MRTCPGARIFRTKTLSSPDRKQRRLREDNLPTLGFSKGAGGSDGPLSPKRKCGDSQLWCERPWAPGAREPGKAHTAVTAPGSGHSRLQTRTPSGALVHMTPGVGRAEGAAQTPGCPEPHNDVPQVTLQPCPSAQMIAKAWNADATLPRVTDGKLRPSRLN